MNTPSRFDWDPVKAARTEAERGISFAYAARVFLDPNRLDEVDTRKNYGEERRKTIGQIETGLFSVVYTLRGSVCWIISARRASRKERRLYGQTRS